MPVSESLDGGAVGRSRTASDTVAKTMTKNMTTAMIAPITDRMRPEMPGHFLPLRNSEISETMNPTPSRSHPSQKITGMHDRMVPSAASPSPTRPRIEGPDGAAGAVAPYAGG